MSTSLLAATLLTGARCPVCPCVVIPGEDHARPGTLVPRAYRTADVVVAGRVIRADTLASDTVYLSQDSTVPRRPLVLADSVRYDLEVTEIWKGSPGPEAVVLVTSASTHCGRSLAVGAAYLLYAYGRAGALQIDACARVVPLENAAIDRQVLGPARRRAPRGS